MNGLRSTIQLKPIYIELFATMPLNSCKKKSATRWRARNLVTSIANSMKKIILPAL